MTDFELFVAILGDGPLKAPPAERHDYDPTSAEELDKLSAERERTKGVKYQPPEAT